MEDTILKRLIATRESKHNAQLTGARTLADMMSQLNSKVQAKVAAAKADNPAIEAPSDGGDTV